MKITNTQGAAIGASLLLCLQPSISHADTILGGYIGAQVWNMGLEGGFAQNSSLLDFDFEDQTNPSFYAALEHPIPLVPNILVAQTTMDTNGSTLISSEFTFGDQVYLVNSNIQTDVEVSATDIILYYEILDNDLVSLDVGINAKLVDSTIFVQDDNGLSSQQSFDGLIPMAYGKLVVGLPLTGLSVFAQGSALAIDDDSFTDYQIGVSYSFAETLPLDIHLTAGYRSTALEIEDLDDINADLEFDGAFVGIEFDF